MKLKSNSARRVPLRSRMVAHSVVLHKLVKSNPRRPGTAGYQSFAVLKNGERLEPGCARAAGIALNEFMEDYGTSRTSVAD